jgi:hypothetical protein
MKGSIGIVVVILMVQGYTHSKTIFKIKHGRLGHNTIKSIKSSSATDITILDTRQTSQNKNGE